MKRLLLLCVVVLASGQGRCADETADAPDSPSRYFDRHAEGWFWYQDPPVPIKKAAPTPIPVMPAEPPDPPEVAQFERMKKDFHNRMVVMMVSPTPTNIKSYVDAQTRLVRLADRVSDGFQRVVWANPEYDFTLERPVNALAQGVRDQEDQRRRLNMFESLAQTHVLYYFFRSDCPYCQAFSPVLANFARSTGIKVFPITLDGFGTPAFPNPKADNGIARTLGVSSVPALFIADPAKGVITPVGFGVMAESELAERLIAIAAPPSQVAAGATPLIPFVSNP